MTVLAQLASDLAAEAEAITSMLAGRPDDDWNLPTPADGWLVRDQIAHLAYFDETALMAVVNPDQFRSDAAVLMSEGMGFPDRLVVEHRGLPIAELRSWFSRARLDLIGGTRDGDPKQRVSWYGPSMSLASCLTARLMETWAHGQDIADALGIVRGPSSSLRHVAHIGIGARAYSFAARGLLIPEVPIRVEVAGPDGATWTWGPPEAADRVTGSALEFCLVVTQRRHRHETDLEITGAAAEEWISIAQAFAGPPGPGRPAPPGNGLEDPTRSGVRSGLFDAAETGPGKR